MGAIFYFSIIVIRPSKKSTLQYYILFILILFACFTSKIKRATFDNPAFWIEYLSKFPLSLPPKPDSLFIFRLIWILHLGLVVCFILNPIEPSQQTKNGLDFIVTFNLFFLCFVLGWWLMLIFVFGLYFNGRTDNIFFLP